MKVFQRIMLIIFLLLVFIVFLFMMYLSRMRNPDKLNLCGLGIVYPYYVNNSYDDNSFFEVKECVLENYIRPKNSKNVNGIVRIQFMIDCNGISGNFRLEVYDLDYRKSYMPRTITKQLLVLTEKCPSWKPPTFRGKPVNIHKFFAYKVVNGEIIDILPK